jgi:excisionase family DNA binding protein
MSAVAARAMKGLREVSDAIAELREAQLMLNDISASQMIAAENRKSSTVENPRLTYRVDEAARRLSVSTKTVKRRIADGTLKSTKMVGVRLIDAKSVKALFEPGE